MTKRVVFYLSVLFWLAPAPAFAAGEEAGVLGAIDKIFAQIVAAMAKVLFLEVGGIPLIVLWLILGAVFFTLRMGFINVRAFQHAFYVILGHYDNPDEAGEVTHFQALSAALSATVGLGNIAGVALAIQMGGPGAVFWMTIAGLFGMTTKFVECTLAQQYRLVRPDGSVAGGPMYYLSKGLSELGWRPFGRGLAVLFSFLCIGAAFGGGNMFQANQSFQAVAGVMPLASWMYGIVVAVLVGVVIIGGIRRIGAVAAALVPTMGVLYALAALWILLSNLSQIPAAIATIFQGAFTPSAAIAGGFATVLVQGMRRSAFSNEAGLGSAPIAHAAARTQEPVREGIVALLEPFIDTVVICNITALVVVVTGAYQQEGLQGVAITQAAFATVIGWFPVLLALATFLFAFSTMISWSYYGEQSWLYLFGGRSLVIYRFMFVSCVFIGSVVNLGSVLDFSDMMLLSMAFPNILGCALLSGKVAGELQSYMSRLRSGEMAIYK